MRRLSLSKIDTILRLPQQILDALGTDLDVIFNLEFYSKGCKDRNTLILDIQSPYSNDILASVLAEKGSHFYYYSTPNTKEEKIKSIKEVFNRLVKVCYECLEVN